MLDIDDIFLLKFRCFSNNMSKIILSFKLRGILPDDDRIDKMVGIPATKIFRKGDLINLKTQKIQHEDLWILNLTKILDDNEATESEINEQILVGAKILEKIAPNINKISSDEFTAELYVSNVREEAQGGFTLPLKLIHAAAIARLPIRISILVE